jgi:hypothetical protein
MEGAFIMKKQLVAALVVTVICSCSYGTTTYAKEDVEKTSTTENVNNINLNVPEITHKVNGSDFHGPGGYGTPGSENCGEKTTNTDLTIGDLNKVTADLVANDKALAEAIKNNKGDKGDKGDQGIQGEQGVAGKDGKDGKDGAAGKDGAKGEQGEQGIQGVQGEQGVAGKDGKDGAAGKDGAKGEQGEQGIQGVQGEQGVAGKDGKDGAAGKDGAKGEQGIQGVQGEQGIQGVQGEQGVAGKDGKDGATGKDGKDGKDGAKGIQGIQGIQGEKGDQGDPGAANTVSAGNGITVVSETKVGNVTDYNVSLDKDFTVKADNTATTPTYVTVEGSSGKVITGNGTNTVTVDGNTGHLTGLTNTSWNGTATTGQAATEDQLSSVANTSVKDVSINTTTGDVTVTKGDGNKETTRLNDYVIDEQTKTVDTDHSVSLKVTDRYNSDNTYNVQINDVAKASEVGSVTDIHERIQNESGSTTVVDSINNLDNLVGTTTNGHYVTNTNTVGENINSLDSNLYDLNNKVNNTDSRLDKVGAAAAALAALHPLDFDSTAKWDFAGGFGHYKGKSAGAIGAFYRPNTNVMFNVGGTLGSEKMWNAGISFKFGKGGGAASRSELEQRVNDLQNRVDALTSQMSSVVQLLDLAKKTDFPDVPDNHWAYEAVTTLAGNGIIHGYPNGNYEGNRTLTRYEMAELIYNALKKGIHIDNKLVKEFSPEIQAMQSNKQ